ncbi:Uncharacterised protein [Enterobacter hormaechei]|nr:Uncharacterised protein [Enterobacter hormaechei]
MLTQFFHRHDALTGHLLDSYGCTFKQFTVPTKTRDRVHQRFQRAVSRIKTSRTEFDEGVGQRLHSERGILCHIDDVLHIVSGRLARVGLVLIQTAQHDAHTLHLGSGFNNRLLPTEKNVGYCSGRITDLTQQKNVTAQPGEHASFIASAAMTGRPAAATISAITRAIPVARRPDTYRFANQLLATDNRIHLIADLFKPFGSLVGRDAPIT